MPLLSYRALFPYKYPEAVHMLPVAFPQFHHRPGLLPKDKIPDQNHGLWIFHHQTQNTLTLLPQVRPQSPFRIVEIYCESWEFHMPHKNSHTAPSHSQILHFPAAAAVDVAVQLPDFAG